MTNIPDPSAWGLETGKAGTLVVEGLDTVKLAGELGTPLHVVNTGRLEETAARFRRAAEAAYPGRVSVHYAMKCNSVSAVVASIRKSGCCVEVMTPFELELALLIGYSPMEIIVNGPCKTRDFLQRCLEVRVKLLVVDSIEELTLVHLLGETMGVQTRILLRINPDYVPRGMNRGSATASRKGCAFGFDLKGGEVTVAMNLLRKYSRLRFAGFQMHVGTGIRRHTDCVKALRCLPDLLRLASSAGMEVSVMDVGGGLASPTARELTSFEMLLYQGYGRLPEMKHERTSTVEEYTQGITKAIGRYCSRENLPELIYEPGRCIASQNQFLLLTVHVVKERPGIGKWLITDGGLGTSTLPTYYEHHEVLLCNEVTRPRTETITMVGPACFAGDIVYRNKWMPAVRPGEIVAIMDAGAYFVALESSFGFSLPAIVAVERGSWKIVRERESPRRMALRNIRSRKKRKERAA